jgi:hypothetical protein
MRGFSQRPGDVRSVRHGRPEAAGSGNRPEKCQRQRYQQCCGNDPLRLDDPRKLLRRRALSRNRSPAGQFRRAKACQLASEPPHVSEWVSHSRTDCDGRLSK